MEYKYWGFIQVTRGGWMQRGNTAKSVTEEIDPALLPDWIKVKMAMLDLMSEYEKLPCGSYKLAYSTSAAWFIYTDKDVSSTRRMDEDNTGRSQRRYDERS